MEGDPKKLLLKRFKEEEYKIQLFQQNKLLSGDSGLNKETIMLSVETFKKFCMFANTKKSENNIWIILFFT